MKGMSTRRSPLADVGTLMALIALAISGLSFYRSYIYTKQDLEITVTEVEYMTSQGEVYMTVAFSNGGNRDAAVLRVEPALWDSQHKPQGVWAPLVDKVHPDIPVTSPKTPLVVKQGGAFLGIRVATMNSDGNLYLLEHAVAKLTLDDTGHITGANPAIHQTLSGFADVQGAPPGDMLQSNKKTPFVWAGQHWAGQ